MPGHTGAALDRRRGTHHCRRSRLGNQPGFVIINAQAVRQGHLRSQYPAALQVLRRRTPVSPAAFVNPARAVGEMQGGAGAGRPGDGRAGGQQFRRAVLGGKRHCPRRHHPVQCPGIPGDGILGDADGGIGIVNGQVERVIPILHAAANDDAAPRPAVGFQAGVQVGCAAGVQECGSAVFEQFGNRQQRGGEFVLGGHRPL